MCTQLLLHLLQQSFRWGSLGYSGLLQWVAVQERLKTTVLRGNVEFSSRNTRSVRYKPELWNVTSPRLRRKGNRDFYLLRNDPMTPEVRPSRADLRLINAAKKNLTVAIRMTDHRPDFRSERRSAWLLVK